MAIALLEVRNKAPRTLKVPATRTRVPSRTALIGQRSSGEEPKAATRRGRTISVVSC
jgi:hypothetical protein